MWNSILNEFIDGWPKDRHDHPSEYEKDMISKFLNSNRYEQMMKDYLDKQIINETMRTTTINDKNKSVNSCYREISLHCGPNQERGRDHSM